MKKSELQDQLVMRQVDVSEMEQFYDLLNYVFQITNHDIQEIGSEFLKEQKRPLLSLCEVIGWFDNDKLVSQLMIYPFHVNIHGVIYAMGGITGVGTYPEYAGHGLIHALMREALRRMKEMGQCVSYLYPYSIPFYRKQGWEIISDRVKYKIRDTQLPKLFDVSGRTARVDWDHPDKERIYELFSARTHAAMIRGHLAWDERFRWERHELSLAIYYNEDKLPSGYLCYKVEEEMFHVREMVYLDNEAHQGLWNFIHAHFSMVYHVKGTIYTNEQLAFYLHDGEIEQRISPNYMARIVDVEQFLLKYAFHKTAHCEIVIRIEDPMADWNQGTFYIRIEAGRVIAIQRDEGRLADVEMDIQTFTTMMFSYRSPAYLHSIDRIQASLEWIDQLEQIIPDAEPWFADYF